MEIRTTQLFGGFLWKEGRNTKAWVRRYFVLIRREQVDEMVDSTNNVLHEFCQFESDSDHAECLGSIVLEEVVKFETGVYAGLPEHEKAAQMLWRAKNPKQKKVNEGTNSRRTMLSNLSDLFPVRFDTTDYEDYTIELSLPYRILRLRAETKSNFESWNALLKQKIPKVQAVTMHEGWMWRRTSSMSWEQCYVVIYEGVLFFFDNREISDKFKLIAARDEDAVFLASQLAQDLICLETCELTQHAIWEDRPWVMKFQVEELEEFVSVVDEAQSDAWVLAVRNARHWFESIMDEHPTRRLFGGLGGEEDGPMLEQNYNPLSASNTGADEDAPVKKKSADDE